MTKTLAHATLLAGLVLGGLATAASAQTLGESVASGRLSNAAFEQLIAHTGLSADEARSMTLEEVVEIRWQDD
jgi:hypothetical protein